MKKPKKYRKEMLREGLTIYLGDCREVMDSIPEWEAIVTDPPYGIAGVWKGGFSESHGWGGAKKEQKVRNNWDDKTPDNSQFEDWIKKSKEIIIWGGNYFDLPPSRGWLVWVKPERNFSLAEAELAWTNMDKVIRVFDKHRFVKLAAGVGTAPNPRNDSDKQHPTQKPVALMVWCLQKIKSNTIIDPYMGSGTTGVAAIEVEKNFIGIEAHEPYFDIACKRLEASLNTPRLDRRKYEPVKKKKSKKGFVK